MDRAAFYTALRSSALFGKALSQSRVEAIEAILDSCERNRVTDPHHVAHILAQVYHETGGKMAPVRETFAQTDAQAIANLERAWKAGKLSWVKTPYWRDGYFGRGMIQLTHKENYERVGKVIGRDLANYPSMAMLPNISADIAVVGMTRGLFTGRKLSDYRFPGALDAPAAAHPRRIVNGKDGTDKKIAGYHRAFFAAIEAANSSSKPAAKPSGLAALLSFIGKILRKIFHKEA